jgi:hypothetical protein
LFAHTPTMTTIVLLQTTPPSYAVIVCWRVTEAFSVFDLTHSCPGDRADSHLERIAKVCDLDTAALKTQWQDVFPRARQIAMQRKDAPDANKDAWRTAVSRINEHHITAKCHPTDVLEVALLFFLAFGVSTSGVEQAFSKSAWFFNNRRLSSLATTEEFCLKVALDLPHHDTQEVIALARRVWAVCYGAPRKFSKTRIDKGVKRPARDDELVGGQVVSEASFLRKRRKAAVEASRGTPLADLGGAAVAMPACQPQCWGEKHTRELEFQRSKLHNRRVQAAAEGSLLPAEGFAALLAEASAARSNMAKAQRARERNEARQASKNTGLTSAEVLGLCKNTKVYIDVSPQAPDLHQSLRANSMQQVSSPALAEVFVVNQPGQADVKADWRQRCEGRTRYRRGCSLGKVSL